MLSIWTNSYFAQILVRHPAFSFIFRGICGFKEAKATVTAVRNTTSVLKRHTATLSSAIPYRLSPGGVISDCVDTKRKNNSRAVLKDTSEYFGNIRQWTV